MGDVAPPALFAILSANRPVFLFSVEHLERVTGFTDGLRPTCHQAASTTATALQPASERHRGSRPQGAPAWARGRSQPGLGDRPGSPHPRARAPLGQRGTASAERGLGADGNVHMCCHVLAAGHTRLV